MEGDELTPSVLASIRKVVKEEIESHYADVAKYSVKWVVGSFAVVVFGAFSLGVWVATLSARVDANERVWLTRIAGIEKAVDSLDRTLTEKNNK